MKEPTTIKGYLQMILAVEKMQPTQMKGYEKLSEKMKGEISSLSGQISNCINTIDDLQN